MNQCTCNKNYEHKTVPAILIENTEKHLRISLLLTINMLVLGFFFWSLAALVLPVTVTWLAVFYGGLFGFFFALPFSMETAEDLYERHVHVTKGK